MLVVQKKRSKNKHHDEKGGIIVSSDVKFLTVEDVAEMLQVTRTTIYNLKKKGLPFIKIGKNIRFDRDEVIEWVKSNSRTTEAKKN